MKDEMILWFMGLQTSIIGIITYLYRNLKEQIKEIKLEVREINQDLKTVNDRMNNIDKRLYGVETILHMQECCALKEDKTMKKAE